MHSLQPGWSLVSSLSHYLLSSADLILKLKLNLKIKLFSMNKMGTDQRPVFLSLFSGNEKWGCIWMVWWEVWSLLDRKEEWTLSFLYCQYKLPPSRGIEGYCSIIFLLYMLYGAANDSLKCSTPPSSQIITKTLEIPCLSAPVMFLHVRGLFMGQQAGFTPMNWGCNNRLLQRKQSSAFKYHS